MSATAGTEAISDYEGFDFAALWHRREKVTEVERGLLTTALASSDPRRLLELGAGFGRLLAPLEAMAREVVVTDFDLTSLAGLRPRDGGSGRTRRVAANVYHLPFVANAFTAASMVRVYHHLSDAGTAMAELRRVLRPAARLFVSYNPRPSVGTLVNDVQRALRPSPGVPFRSITFARSRHVELPPDPFPVHVGPRQEFAATARAAGFECRGEMVSGLEEYYLMRHVPTRLFVRLGTTFGGAPGFPMRFALLAVPAGPAEPLPPLSEILACPRCHAAFGRVEDAGAVVCRRCTFRGAWHGDVLDLRFAAPGSSRWQGGAHAR